MGLSPTLSRQIDRDGFALLAPGFATQTLTELREELTRSDDSEEAIHALRHLLYVRPAVWPLLQNDPFLHQVVETVLGRDAVLSKAILFDKPAEANWFVAYHQDISIHVNERVEVPGFEQWTFREGMHGVVPPVEVLEQTLTVRIHLDDTTAENGALRVLAGSHRAGITAKPAADAFPEVTCELPAGGALLMKPLLFHASHRATKPSPRRVIHLEFCARELPVPLEFAERRELGSG